MTKAIKKNQPATRPLVDADQYEKLALSAFQVCERQLSQLDTLVTLAASICRTPAVTLEDRQSERRLLELLVDTVERYRQEVECDRELYQVIALDAKGVPHSRITAKVAAKILSDAAQAQQEEQEAEMDAASDKAATCKPKRIRTAATARVGAQQAVV